MKLTASRFRLIALSACIGVFMAACGGDDAPPDTGGGGGGGGGTPGNGGGVGGGGGGGSDTAKPVANLTSPLNLADPLTGTVTLQATASDNVSVASVEFQIDGVTIGTADTTSPYTATVNVADHPAGQHILRARARDAAGNLSDWSTATVRFGGTTTVPKGFTQNNAWITGLNSATAMAQAPDGRIFIAQKGGTVRIVKNGQLLTQPLLDNQASTDSAGERGFIGIALHPDFATNGWLYVHYTNTVGGSHGRISRYVVSGDTSDGFETALVNLPVLSSATNHNGGAIHFGPDGKLYVGVGDNADRTRSPLLTSVFGKILRFNDDGTIPTDNPHYATQTGLARAIWARGLRNPFTFAVQPGTGTLYINDVGEGDWEEINVGAAGANYGWPATEGPTTEAGITAPLFAYNHRDANPPGSGPGGFFTGFSIAGGAFYPATGPFAAAYRGNYFFADYVSRYVGRLDLANGNAASTFATLSANPVDLLVGSDGALYVLGLSAITRISAN
jgi:glucose/arabinose dehydrogenase